MNRFDLFVGQEVHWHKTVSNYGHISIIRAKVKRIGKRVTLEVPQIGGGTRTAVVRAESLRAATNQ